MIYFGVSTRNGVGLGLGTVPSLTNTPLGYRLAPSLNLSFAGSDTLDPRITFSRTTNATLTNSAGLIANAPMNLLTFSEQFDNAVWGKALVTITANATAAPDGTITADRFVSSGGSFPQIAQAATVPVGANITFSVWVLSDGTSQIQQSLLFDGATANFTPTGTWTRVSVTKTATAGGSKSAVIATNAGPAAASSFYIWGAQLELGSTATTYNPTTVKNLLGFTENFDNAAWTKSNASISATKVDDIYGQPFAQQVTSSASNGTVLSTYTAVASTPYTFNIWMKRVTGTGNIDISADGTTWTTQTLTTEWQRFSVTVSPTAGSKTPGVRIATSGDSIYIFGAQLSDSASVDPYVYNPVAVPTAQAYYGPRFDYDPVTLAPKGLLIEEQRTNLFLQSQFGGVGIWNIINVALTVNAAVAPDGTVTAASIVPNTTAGVQHSVVQTTTATLGVQYAYSVYAKANGYTNIQFFGDSSGNFTATFDLTAGSAAFGGSATAASITPVGNGWYRCVAIFTMASSARLNVQGFPTGATASNFGNTFTGNGTSGVFVWGAQLEQSSFSTSYIPTGASQVTRAADSASMIGNNFARWYNQTEGTLYLESSAAGGVAGAAFSFQNDAVSNEAIWVQSDTRSNGYDGAIRTASGFSAAFGYPLAEAAGTMSKRALAYKVNDFALSKNGTTALTDTAGPLPSALVRMQLGSPSVATYTGAVTSGTIKRIAYYNRRLSNTELQGITS